MNTTEFTVGYTWKAHSMDGFYVSQTSVQDTDQLVVVIKLANEAEAKKFAAAPRLLEKLEMALRIIDNALPPLDEPAHVCTPESFCDMDCMERAAVGKGLHEIRSLIAEVKRPST